MRHNASSFLDYRGAIFKMSGSGSFMARSCHVVLCSVPGLTTPSWQWVHSEASGLGLTLSRCTPCLGEAERSDTHRCTFGVERIANDFGFLNW